jgi:hypothetical protein
VSGQRAPVQNHRAGWPPVLQFTWDLLGDPARFRRALFAIALLGLAGVAIGYQATVHIATWQRFAVTATAIVIVTGGGGLVRQCRRRRHRRTARLAGRQPTAKAVATATPQDAGDGLTKLGGQEP